MGFSLRMFIPGKTSNNMIKSLDQPSAKTTKITKTKELRKQKTLQEKKKILQQVLSHTTLNLKRLKHFPTYYILHASQEL